MKKVFADTSADQESECSTQYGSDFRNYIDQHSEQLFFIRVKPRVSQIGITTNEESYNLFKSEYNRMSSRRDRGILSKFTESKKNVKWKILDKKCYEHGTDGILKEIKIRSPLKSKSFLKTIENQKYKCLFEIMFEATVIFVDKKCLLSSLKETSIFNDNLLVGDVIKSIDGENITSENMDIMLKRILGQKWFKIVAIEFFEKDPSRHEIIKITKLQDILSNKEKLFRLDTSSSEVIFSLNIISQNGHDHSGLEHFRTIFAYPQNDNLLHKLKGSFLTISSILKTSLGSPQYSDIKIQNMNFRVAYPLKNNDKFILIGFNTNYVQTLGVHRFATYLIKFLEFTFPNFNDLTNYEHLKIFCELMKIQILKQSTENFECEELFEEYPTTVALPREIVLKLNDSLSELEAMDYRNWNEGLMELFGKFNITGSCFFYKTSLICTHFNDTQMRNIELMLRRSGLKLLFQNCLVHEIAMWQRVYPQERQSYDNSPKNKVFILFAAYGNLMICVMLEENRINSKTDVETQSFNYLSYFIEEMYNILNHLKVVGIEKLSKIWINLRKRPQCNNFFASEISQEFDKITGLNNLKEEDEISDLDSQFDSQKSGSIFDGKEFSESICKDFSEIIPQTLTFGAERNVLYHLINVDLKDGMCISTLSDQYSNGNDFLLTEVIRKGCVKIHNMLENTIKFNLLLEKQNNKIPYKTTTMTTKLEIGILIQWTSDDKRKHFWITGRLIGTKQLFICHDTRIPQNLVEIAFRFRLSATG